MPSNMPLVSEMLNVKATKGAPIPVRESDIWTSCPSCAQTVRLNEAVIVDRSDPLEVIHSCAEGCGPILIVGTPVVVAWEGRGYRLGDWVIRNPRDLLAQGRGMRGVVVIPASPHALD
jgi:hypothetical protein